jgi:hypothetical protein
MKWALPLISAVTACSAAPKSQVDEATLSRQAEAISNAANAAVAKDVAEIEAEAVTTARTATDETEVAPANAQ